MRAAGLGNTRSACGSRADGPGQDAGVRARPALDLSPDSPGPMRHLAAGAPQHRQGPLRATRTRPAALRPQTPKWLSETAEPPGLGPRIHSEPCEAALSLHPGRPLPGIFLLGLGTARKSSRPDPLSGRSSSNSGLTCHGSDQLLSPPT